MQFFRIFFALVAAALASAQIPNLPSCSLNCFIDALGSDGCASLTDFACHCQKPDLSADITPCVKKACDEPAQSSVSSIVASQCSEAGHPISIPPVDGTPTTLSAVTGVTTVPAETTSAVDTGSVSDTVTGTVTIMSTGAPNSPTGLATPAQTSPPSPTSGPLITPGIGSSSVHGSASGSVPVSSSAIPSSSTSVPLFPGAAAPNVQSNVAGVMGVAVAVVAAYAL